MNLPQKNLRRDTRVFISAVTRELGSVRKLVKKALEDSGYHADNASDDRRYHGVEQTNFPLDYRELTEKLQNLISSCDAVVHIAGKCYGAEPPNRLANASRRSYTQLEYDIASELGRPVYVIVTDDSFKVTKHAPEVTDLTSLQVAHRTALTSSGKEYLSAKTRKQITDKIRSLKLRADALSGELQWTYVEIARVRRWVKIVAALAFLCIGIAGLVLWRQSMIGGQVSEVAKKVQQGNENVGKLPGTIEESQQKTSKQIETAQEKTVQALTDPAALAEMIRKQIRATAEEKINALRNEKGSWRKEEEIKKERDLALGRVDDLIKLIQEGLKEGASPVFKRASEILQKEGTDEALAYLESSRPSTLKTARRHAEQSKIAQARTEAEKEQRNKTLQALVLEAELLETKLQWEPALALREQVAELAPDWFEARNYLGLLLDQLARYREAEPHERAALALATNPLKEAVALNNLAELLHATNRLAEAELLMRRAMVIHEKTFRADHPKIALHLNNLAALLQDTNRPAEAEPLMRRALAIDEQSYGAEHPHVARDLGNLASLLQATNRLAEAEPLMRRALVIDEKCYGAEHPDIAIRLNNLATLLLDTNRLAEGEPLTRRALAIGEKTLGSDHPRVAFAVKNLASLLQATNRLAEAEPLMRRALAIDEQSYGAEHPNVATDLNNLASLLRDTNRLAEGEPLMRRALTIDTQSYGTEHPDVARDLNNLAQFLKDTYRLAEAETLMRCALAIEEQSYGAEHPNVAIYLNNLAGLLYATNRIAEAEQLMRRHVAIFKGFERRTGHEHPNMQAALANYRVILQAMELTNHEIARRVKDATAIAGPLPPVIPELERLLGPAPALLDVLAALDRQYKADGKPAVYFLSPDQPMAPHLGELLQPTPESLNAASASAYRGGAYVEAFVLCEEALKLLADTPNHAATTFRTRMNRAATLRELGEVEQAREEFRRLLSGLDELGEISAVNEGRARYHLAQCEWRLGGREAAEREAEESLNAYGKAQLRLLAFFLASTNEAAIAPLREQTEQLLADLKDNKPHPPLAKVDTVAALENARVRFRARADLATLPLNQSALPLLDQMLGPAQSTEEVFATLDRRYREEGKPAVWFLPLTEPIAPHLDELLGPVGSSGK